MKRVALVVGIVSLVASLSFTACTKKNKDAPNTIRVAVPAKIKGLDPIYTDDLYSHRQVNFVYEGLLQYHYLKRPYQLIGNLAESMPEVSKDGKTLTFKIKKGVRFQDDPCFKATQGKGRELTAEDFIYSWKRVADPKNASPGWWIFDGRIEGFNEWRAEATKSGAADYAKAISGLQAPDPYTLVIKLNKSSAIFLYGLAMGYSYVIPREAVEHYGKDFISKPVGTGPYKLDEFNGASRIIWSKSPTYRGEKYPSEGEAGDQEKGLLADAGKTLPLNDKVIVRVFEESQPLWLTFMKAELDTAGVPKDNFESAYDRKTKQLKPELVAKGLQLLTNPELDITHTSFNMADPLVGKNKLLRQALSLAVDQEGFNETFYNGRAIAAQTPIPPGIAGYEADFKNPYRQANIEKAKELLAKAGYPNGQGLPPLEVAGMSDSTARQISEYEAKEFAKIGVKLKINAYSWPEFQNAVKTRRGQMWGFAWSADYPDAENFLQLFYSKNASPGPNDANYNNPEFDKLYEKTLAMQDTPERTAIYKQMVKILVEDCPWIFGAHRLAFQLYYPWLKNMKIHDFDHAFYKYYRIDEAVKAQKQ